MVKIKQKPNYGFPLSFMIYRFSAILFLILILAIFILSKISIYLILLVCLIIIPLYSIFGIIRSKNNFIKSREILLKKFIKLADLKGDEKVLDLGTGSGFLAIGFAKKLKKGKSYGLDKFSFKNNNIRTQIRNIIKTNYIYNNVQHTIDNSKIEKVENNCEFLKADITKPLDFSDSYFDIIVSSQFLYCITPEKREQVYKEINRILKKGGKIIFFEAISFMNWDINEVKDFFKKVGYKTKIIPITEFKRCYIFYGKK